MEKNLTSIIILSYNTLEMTRMCLESIRAHTPEAYELIVVDNASEDGSLEYLREQADVRLIENQENMGFPKGCNQGLEIAQGDSLLLLNSDTVVTENWLGNLKKGLYSEEKVGAVSCVANYVSNRQQIDVPYGMDMEAMQAFAAGFNHSDPAKWEERPHLVGFCYLFRREVYEAVGGLDERFTPGNFEDNDYSLRILEQGYKLLLLRDTFIHHWGSGSFKKVEQESRENSQSYIALSMHNMQKFFEKWQLPPSYLRKPQEEVREYISQQRQREMRLREQPELLRKAAVVIPAYKESLSPTEEISLRQLRRVLPWCRKIFVVPEGLQLRYGGLEEGFEVQEFPKKFFQGIEGYSRLLLTTDFYSRFKDYEYILIHQLDVFLFEDKLLEFCDMGYDYIGAPCPKFDLIWHLVEAQVGNGGLSLRKVKSCLNLLHKHRRLLKNHPYSGIFLNNEDSFFGYAGNHLPDFKVPDVGTALTFAIQDNICRVLKGDLELPLGIHAFHKINSQLWRSVITREYAYPDYEVIRDGDFRIVSLQVYLRMRKILPMQTLFGALKAGKPQKALSIIKKWHRPETLSAGDWDFLTAYLDTLVLYAKNREPELRKRADIKASKAFREELTKFISLIMKTRGAFANPWITDLTRATFQGIEE
ncbi:MAG: glycosyltransferase family 2 protein [Selenomonas sp.]|nr:glycosyltransferase family 2 protein [Selenomonas sp.]